MNPQRKKLYIILIVACIGLSIAIMLWSRFSTSSPDPTDSVTALPTDAELGSVPEASGNFLTGFSAPRVFPSSDKFNTDVLDSSAFLHLTPYTPVDATGQVGRPDPFRSY